jgi:hypothetical protein
MGYAGAFEVAYRLKRLISNSQYNRNTGKYRSLPYREREPWYEKEVSSYTT